MAVDKYQRVVRCITGNGTRPGGECRGGDEDALGCPKLAQSAAERLDFGCSNVVTLGITLGLQVYAVEAQGILPDNPVDTLVAGTLRGLEIVLAVGSVAQRPHNERNETLEGVR